MRQDQWLLPAAALSTTVTERQQKRRRRRNLDVGAVFVSSVVDVGVGNRREILFFRRQTPS